MNAGRCGSHRGYWSIRKRIELSTVESQVHVTQVYVSAHTMVPLHTLVFRVSAHKPPV